MKVCVIGAGYVGLVTASGFAETGNNVVCADLNAGRIAALNRHEIPIFEPGLETMIKYNIDGGRLTFTTNVEEAILHAEVIFVAVGTGGRFNG